MGLMLTLTRKPGEAFLIDGGIVVRVHKVTPSRVELAIEAPADVPIRRGEIVEGFSILLQEPTPWTASRAG
jgi:carbon storage regulator CsrA